MRERAIVDWDVSGRKGSERYRTDERTLSGDAS